MNEPSPRAVRFSGFTLDIARGRLVGAAGDVWLRPKSYALLVHMARNAGRVVPKDELLAAVWPGVAVTEDSITRCVHEVRRALGAAGPAVLRTVPRRGYVFDAPPPAEARAAAPPAGFAGAPPCEDDAGLRRDGIAVLPFAPAVPGDPSDSVLLDGLADDVSGRLARMRGFHVIARGSTFALRRLVADPQAAGRALGVAHVAVGTAAFRDGRVRLRLDIVAAADGSVVWSGEFDEDRRAYADLIGALTGRVALAIHREVTRAETRRALSRPPETLTAWEYYHAGLADVFRPEADRITVALGRFRAATRLAPRFARAHAAQSACHYVLAFTGLAADPAGEAAAARRTAEAGLEADDDDPQTQWCYGRALWLAGDRAGCLRHAERAVAISPGYAFAHHEIAAVESMHGDAARAVQAADLFIALSPFDPVLCSIQTARAHAAYRLGRLDEAAAWARAAAAQRVDYPTILAPAALLLAEAGDSGGAHRIAARLRGVIPAAGMEGLRRAVDAMSDDLLALRLRHGARLGL